MFDCLCVMLDLIGLSIVARFFFSLNVIFFSEHSKQNYV